MRRGTTPYITIDTDEDLTKYSYVLFTMEGKDGTEVNVDNSGDAMQITSTQVIVKLTQDQTLSMPKGGVKMQIRAADAAGNAVASNIMSASMEDILKDGVIGG